MCSSLGLWAATERGGWTSLLSAGGPPAVPPLPPAAPPARPASLTCSARHRALSRGGSRTLGPWGRVCVCACVSADGMGDPGQGPSFVSGWRGGCASAPPPSLHLPLSCCPRGRPRSEATSIYSPSVPPPVSSFLPARLPPAPSQLSVLDPRARGGGWGRPRLPQGTD